MGTPLPTRGLRPIRRPPPVASTPVYRVARGPAASSLYPVRTLGRGVKTADRGSFEADSTRCCRISEGTGTAETGSASLRP